MPRRPFLPHPRPYKTRQRCSLIDYFSFFSNSLSPGPFSDSVLATEFFVGRQPPIFRFRKKVLLRRALPFRINRFSSPTCSFPASLLFPLATRPSPSRNTRPSLTSSFLILEHENSVIVFRLGYLLSPLLFSRYPPRTMGEHFPDTAYPLSSRRFAFSGFLYRGRYFNPLPFSSSRTGRPGFLCSNSGNVSSLAF